MILAVAQWGRDVTFAMRGQPEADGVAVDFDPHMTARVACTPTEQDHGVEFLKIPPALKSASIDGFQHFGEATFLHDMFCIFTHCHTPGLIRFLAEDKFCFFVL